MVPKTLETATFAVLLCTFWHILQPGLTWLLVASINYFRSTFITVMDFSIWYIYCIKSTDLMLYVSCFQRAR